MLTHFGRRQSTLCQELKPHLMDTQMFQQMNDLFVTSKSHLCTLSYLPVVSNLKLKSRQQPLLQHLPVPRQALDGDSQCSCCQRQLCRRKQCRRHLRQTCAKFTFKQRHVLPHAFQVERRSFLRSRYATSAMRKNPGAQWYCTENVWSLNLKPKPSTPTHTKETNTDVS